MGEGGGGGVGDEGGFDGGGEGGVAGGAVAAGEDRDGEAVGVEERFEDRRTDAAGCLAGEE